MNNFPIGDAKPSKGPVLGTIIIVILIIIGGIYIISSRRGEVGVTPGDQTGAGDQTNAGDATNVTPDGNALDNQAAALNGLQSIETELDASETDLQNLDQELQ